MTTLITGWERTTKDYNIKTYSSLDQFGIKDDDLSDTTLEEDFTAMFKHVGTGNFLGVINLNNAPNLADKLSTKIANDISEEKGYVYLNSGYLIILPDGRGNFYSNADVSLFVIDRSVKALYFDNFSVYGLNSDTPYSPYLSTFIKIPMQSSITSFGSLGHDLHLQDNSFTAQNFDTNVDKIIKAAIQRKRAEYPAVCLFSMRNSTSASDKEYPNLFNSLGKKINWYVSEFDSAAPSKGEATLKITLPDIIKDDSMIEGEVAWFNFSSSSSRSYKKVLLIFAKNSSGNYGAIGAKQTIEMQSSL